MTSMSSYYIAGPRNKTHVSIWSVGLPMASVKTQA